MFGLGLLPILHARFVSVSRSLSQQKYLEYRCHLCSSSDHWTHFLGCYLVVDEAEEVDDEVKKKKKEGSWFCKGDSITWKAIAPELEQLILTALYHRESSIGSDTDTASVPGILPPAVLQMSDQSQVDPVKRPSGVS